jgi:hypothetical protein
LERPIINSVRTCFGLTVFLDLVELADHRTEIDCTELLDVEPWLDELSELLS